MTRLLAVALAAAVFGVSSAQAQSGHALVLAEQACLGQGLPPATAVYNGCVARLARAYDRGELRDPYSGARHSRRHADDGFYPRAGGDPFR